MEKIKFFNGEFKVKYRSEEIVLLPKEFQLLHFLYQSPSRIFTREELLDAVWPMEAPTDRTVDDHIYRVRKKLRSLSSVVSIETVRGQGYRLKLSKEAHASPLLKDEEVSSNVKTLFHKYHLYGQGDALKLLAENQSVFGFELDQQSRLYLHFMRGDFRWFLEEKEISFWEKCYYLLHIYSYIEADKYKCLDYFTRALTAKELPEHYRLEIRLLNRLSFLIYTKQVDEAEILLLQSEKEIHEKNLEGFIPLISLTELYLAVLRSDTDRIDKKMAEMEKMLVKYPFLREKAIFYIIKGIKCITLEKKQTEAEHYFDQGFDLFREAKYIPGVLSSINIILFFLNELQIENNLYAHYQKVWERYDEEYQFVELKRQISSRLDFYLK
ncbi:winged helix-turn-helix domain-containing protein [Lentibacillus sp. Marseille-P4043]|uniref:winged helix-turn-helix domain-containing protein n=1 Tax=Lentibacillus sp. Marseille-P4043 TaxID=2040293 RepID=UPI00131A5069|nr:winged helix-turn-helix domain-containing protein [Lentibacillus sp. Marseille-P4043]